MASEFNALTDVPCKRLCYVGADSFLEGKQCAEVMGDKLGGKGQVIITTGFLNAAGLELRRKGFSSTIRDKFPEIEIVEVFENFENPEITYKRMLDMLARYPRLAGVYVTEGATPHAVARAVGDEKKVRKSSSSGHDLTVGFGAVHERPYDRGPARPGSFRPGAQSRDPPFQPHRRGLDAAGSAAPDPARSDHAGQLHPVLAVGNRPDPVAIGVRPPGQAGPADAESGHQNRGSRARKIPRSGFP